jgi:hypothetical protein
MKRVYPLIILLVAAFSIASRLSCSKSDDGDGKDTTDVPDTTDTVKCEDYYLKLTDWKAKADSIAIAYSPDAQLTLIIGQNLDTTGHLSICDTVFDEITTEPTWKYLYASSIKQKIYSVIFRNRANNPATTQLQESLPIMGNYLDSDTIMAIYMEKAGRSILSEYPGVQLNLYLEVNNSLYNERLVYSVEAMNDTLYKMYMLDAKTGEWLGQAK